MKKITIKKILGNVDNNLVHDSMEAFCSAASSVGEAEYDYKLQHNNDLFITVVYPDKYSGVPFGETLEAGLNVLFKGETIIYSEQPA